MLFYSYLLQLLTYHPNNSFVALWILHNKANDNPEYAGFKLDNDSCILYNVRQEMTMSNWGKFS